ncbi:MAG: hypothetical protein KAS32_04510 [Candidatus Peribacteraceae bacterium]|nr:hypothetical protein [Candidatus Peribacteraceae bacterium]
MEFHKTLGFKELDFIQMAIEGTEISFVFKERNLDHNRNLVCEAMHGVKIDLNELMHEAHIQIGKVMESLYDTNDMKIKMTEEGAITIVQTLATGLMASKLANNLSDDIDSIDSIEPF